ncbi:MAG: hypothetical protein ACLQG3_14560 [Terracidiphilus sp.]
MIHEVLQPERQDRVAYIDANGDAACITREGGVAEVPREFSTTLRTLCSDLELALDCIEVFGGVPLSVARAILRNIDPAQAALDLAFKSGKGAPNGETQNG